MLLKNATKTDIVLALIQLDPTYKNRRYELYLMKINDLRNLYVKVKKGFHEKV